MDKINLVEIGLAITRRSPVTGYRQIKRRLTQKEWDLLIVGIADGRLSCKMQRRTTNLAIIVTEESSGKRLRITRGQIPRELLRHRRGSIKALLNEPSEKK